MVTQTWHVHTLKYCSGIKRNLLLIHNNLDKSPKNHEWKSQSHKVTYWRIPFMQQLLKWQHSRNGEQIRDCQRWRKARVGQKWAWLSTQGILEAAERLCLNCISINILVVVFYYSCTRCYHSKRLGKEYKESLRITSYNCMGIYLHLT